MNQGLTQGMLGGGRQALAPSLLGVGPNAYLGRRDFALMLAIALLVHLLAFAIVSLFPQEKVTHIPVRALSFKLGDRDRIAAYDQQGGQESRISAPVMRASAPVEPVKSVSSDDAPRVAPKPLPQPAPAPKPVKPQKIASAPRPKPASRPTPAPEPEAPHYTPFSEQPSPAIASRPQQYVREVGQANSARAARAANRGRHGTRTGAIGGSGNESTQTAQTIEAVRQRYEQEISAWIERHKIYPAAADGRQGRVIVRIRIDRSGVIRYYALEQSSGTTVIDEAAVDMVRRANPVPSVPANYPAGNLIEFLIPINFHP